MKNTRIIHRARDFNLDPSLENGARLYESFVKILRENDMNLDSVIELAVKNRYYLDKNSNRDILMTRHVTKDCFVDALLEASEAIEDSHVEVTTIED